LGLFFEVRSNGKGAVAASRKVLAPQDGGASGSQAFRVDADYGRAAINLFIKFEP
jgi:hypothetical protein